MTRRVNVARAIVVPWQVPDFDSAGESRDFHELELIPDRRRPPVAGEATMPLAAEASSLATQGAMIAILPETAPEAPSRGHGDGFDAGRNEGRAQGYAEGLALGQRAAEQHLVAELRLLDTMIRRLGEPSRALERRVEEAIVALALEVARWVIGTEVSRSADYLVRLIREAVNQVPIDVGTPAIVLNPIDIELVRGLAPDFDDKGIPLVGDESVEPGGCLVIADGAEGAVMKDRRWHPRAHQGVCEVDLTLASRWRNAMLAMFEGEEV
jgi:flagellar assembly protein FliH